MNVFRELTYVVATSGEIDDSLAIKYIFGAQIPAIEFNSDDKDLINKVSQYCEEDWEQEIEKYDLYINIENNEANISGDWFVDRQEKYASGQFSVYVDRWGNITGADFDE
jgi:hypothetical protein